MEMAVLSRRAGRGPLHRALQNPLGHLGFRLRLARAEGGAVGSFHAGRGPLHATIDRDVRLLFTMAF